LNDRRNEEAVNDFEAVLAQVPEHADALFTGHGTA
jgi:hypothetical protein